MSAGTPVVAAKALTPAAAAKAFPPLSDAQVARIAALLSLVSTAITSDGVAA